MNSNPTIINESQVEWTQVKLTDHIQHSRKNFTRDSKGNQMIASLYEVEPGKANWPYHYHMANEELFFILEGEGELRTPKKRIPIRAGDFLQFQTGPEGAHQFINTSENTTLKYLDIGTAHEPDAVVMPDSNKVGVFGGAAPGQKKEDRYFWKYFNLDQEKQYLDGE